MQGPMSDVLGSLAIAISCLLPVVAPAPALTEILCLHKTISEAL